MRWLLVIKFLSCVGAIFSTTLYVSSVIRSITAPPEFMISKDNVESDTTLRDASFRILIGIIMSILWSIVIVF